MSSDDFMNKAMEQAKELQARIAQALNDSDKLRATLKSGSDYLQRFLRGDS